MSAFVALTEGKTHDLSAARALRLPKGSIVVMDRGYTDDAWYKSLNNKDIFFVTRLKTNARYRVIERRTVPKNKGLTGDQTIQLTDARAKNGPTRLSSYWLQRRRYGHPVHLPDPPLQTRCPHHCRYLQGPLAEGCRLAGRG